MSKEMINKSGTLLKQRTTPDWQEGYEQGLLAGFTKSIVLIRHLQRTLSLNKDPINNSLEKVKRITEREILTEAMELIAEKIETNNNDEFFSREDDAREI